MGLSPVYKSLKTAVILRSDWQNFFTVSVAHPPTPPRADPLRDRDDRRDDRRGREDETMIAETIVEAAEAMGLYTGTLKSKVGLVAQISSHTCHAIAVVLILTARIVNIWYLYARSPLFS